MHLEDSNEFAPQIMTTSPDDASSSSSSSSSGASSKASTSTASSAASSPQLLAPLLREKQAALATSRSPSRQLSDLRRAVLSSPVIHPSRPALPGRESSFYSLLGEGEREDSDAPLFMGIDLSEKALKVSVLSESLLLVHEEVVNFTDVLQPIDPLLPSADLSDPEKAEPILTWIAALDLVLDKLIVLDVPLERVVAISGAAAPLTPVFWSDQAESILSDLDSSYHLRGQLKDAFNLSQSTDGRNSSIAVQCVEKMRRSVGGNEELAHSTGGTVHSRSSAVKLYQARSDHPNAFDECSRISLASSFLTTLFCADGKVRRIDEAEAGMTKLWDVGQRHWSDELCNAVGGDGLKDKLGNVELDSSKVAGSIGEWFVSRFGFRSDCQVCHFTGDSAASFSAFALRPDDIAIQLNDSDCLLVGNKDYVRSSDAAVQTVAVHASSADISPTFFSLISVKNGFNARSYVCQRYSSASYPTFASQLASFEAPFSSSSAVGFYYVQPELSPLNTTGIYRFEGSMPVAEFSNPAWNARACVESQLFNYKSLIRSISSTTTSAMSRKFLNLRRIYLTGSESTTREFVELLSSILGAPVIAPPLLTRRASITEISLMAPNELVKSTVDSHSPSIGAAMKAYWSWTLFTRKNAGKGFVETIQGVLSKREEVFAVLLEDRDREREKMFEGRELEWMKLRRGLGKCRSDR